MDIQNLERMIQEKLGHLVLFHSHGAGKELYFNIFNVESDQRHELCLKLIQIEADFPDYVITPVFYSAEETMQYFPEFAVGYTTSVKKSCRIKDIFNEVCDAQELEELALAA